MPEAIEKITERQKTLVHPVDGWMSLTESIGSWGVAYLRRACVDLIGLGANLAEDAVYPVSYLDADGEPYDGGKRYVLHFDADRLPPAKAFWSLTMYEAEGFQVENQLERFAIGDRDDLELNPHGSLDLQIGATEPEQGTANWLPAPDGPFNLCLRLYYPEPTVLDGSWTPTGGSQGLTAGPLARRSRSSARSGCIRSTSSSRVGSGIGSRREDSVRP